MKRILFFAVLFALFGLANAAAAEVDATPPGSNGTVVAAPAPIAAPVYKPREVILGGNIAAISGPSLPADLTIKLTRIVPAKMKNFPSAYPQKDASVTVHLTEKTKIVRRYYGKADFSELAVGDKVWINGRLQADGGVEAKLVKDDSIHITFYARKGEVISLDSASQTFIIKNDKKEFKIFVTPNTKFAKWGVKEPTFADLKVGDEVRVRGVIRQRANEITADSVVIVPGQKEVQALKLQKQKEALKNQLEKKKEQLEKKIEKMKGKAVEKFQKELEEVNKKLEDNAAPAQ